VSYVQACLSYGAGVVPDVSESRDLRDQSALISEHVHQLFAVESGRAALTQYVAMITQLLAVHSGQSAALAS